jgi:hypothetical protein
VPRDYVVDFRRESQKFSSSLMQNSVSFIQLSFSTQGWCPAHSRCLVYFRWKSEQLEIWLGAEVDMVLHFWYLWVSLAREKVNVPTPFWRQENDLRENICLWVSWPLGSPLFLKSNLVFSPLLYFTPSFLFFKFLSLHLSPTHLTLCKVPSPTFPLSTVYSVCHQLVVDVVHGVWEYKQKNTLRFWTYTL